ncbi:MAG: polysulfide reductase NrfD [Desulfurococcaceae archaeon]|nr:polysulfide reductase NrfD [Desulfurococcaceae archaeon]
MTPLIHDIYTQEQVAGWGWLIAIFLWLAGMAGMGSVAYYWYRKASMAYTLLISIVLALIFVIADLTRPWNVPNAILTALVSGTYNWYSWMALGIILLLIQTLLLLIVSANHVFKGRMRSLALIAESKTYLIILGFFGFLVTIYSGFLISQASGISLWNTPAIPILWILSASTCAVALIEIFVSASPETMSEIKETGVRIGFSIDVFEIFTILAFLYTAFTIGTVGASLGAEKILFGELSPLFWIGVIGLGTLYPALVGAYTILTRKINRPLIISAAVLALIGALLLRYIILVGGVYEPLSTSAFT